MGETAVMQICFCSDCFMILITLDTRKCCDKFAYPSPALRESTTLFPQVQTDVLFWSFVKWQVKSLLNLLYYMYIGRFHCNHWATPGKQPYIINLLQQALHFESQTSIVLLATPNSDMSVRITQEKLPNRTCLHFCRAHWQHALHHCFRCFALPAVI